ncbi:MAG TPA: FtsX-like permease family protein [Acetivibrio sp.]|uniref:FtsX-like permease family protein n=1 Tax=Acetivibrio sp. TaxID=1872092 RepID=UPI002BBB7ADA|nr:FtsX-like permease family protein [Acetivibrio sp.]HOM01271.1 FtsX-like permease family protein [Acetivibrio sp.]
MRRSLFPSLAWQNIRKNAKFYLPYILTIIGTVAGFYIITAIASDEGVAKLRGAAYVKLMMSLGINIICIFAVIFLLYTNSFLMKRRHKELALYNMLGMEKRHIAWLLCCESLYVGVIGIGGGLLCGILLHKLVTLALFKLLRFDVPFGFTVSIEAIKASAILFSIIIAITLLFNLVRIRKAKPIELLKSSSAGEKEPKTKWLLALIGVLSLGAGYYIALTTKTAIQAIMIYFLAVFLVIIGTYCLFTAVSIVVLKQLRRNKKLYYKTKYFIGISGMLYRMKQNAVGLANICILSTMVLVMVSGTLSLYLGTENMLDRFCPGQIVPQIAINNETENRFQKDIIIENIKDIISKNNGKITKLENYTYLAFAAGRGENYYHTTITEGFNAGFVQLCFITGEDYAKFTGKKVDLEENEILFFSDTLKDKENLRIEAGDYSFEFTIVKRIESFPSFGDITAIVDTGYAVVKDDEVLQALYKGQKSAYGEAASDIKWVAIIDTDLNEDNQLKCAREIGNLFSADSMGVCKEFLVNTRVENSTDFYAASGGFLFLGLFLGFLFNMATVLIIYYKQISEGYEDKERFEIMQKVGLPKKEIKRSINMQILIVFFAPLIVAAIHVAFDFRLMIQLLSLFSLTNNKLTMLCTLGTLLGFAVIYGIVYWLTARTYYKIVSAE